MKNLKDVFDYFNIKWPKSNPSNPARNPGSNKILVWFLLAFTLIGFVIAWATGILTDGISASTWIMIGLAAIGLWMAFGGGTGVSAGSVSQVGKSWLMPIVIAIAILMVTAEVFPEWWENATWITIFLIAAFIVLLFMMKKHRSEGRVFIGIGLVLLFLKPGCESYGGKDSAQSEVKTAQMSSPVREIDTIVKLTGNKDFYFQTGPYMDYDIIAVTTGRGFWWKKVAVVYFEMPSGKIFNADEEGDATALHPDNGSTEGVMFGLFRVWGTGSVHIKTTWQDPDAKAKIASN